MKAETNIALEYTNKLEDLGDFCGYIVEQLQGTLVSRYNLFFTSFLGVAVHISAAVASKNLEALMSTLRFTIKFVPRREAI